MSQTFLIISIIILSIISIILLNKIIELGFKLWQYKKYGEPPSQGMYYDAELGSINGEIDNRPKFVCDICEKRYKTEEELIVHLRGHKMKKMKKNKKKRVKLF